MSNFSVGQKVVCVDDSWARLFRLLFATPRRGVVYTVRGKVVWAGDAGLLLVEVVNPPTTFCDGTFGEVAFGVCAFRPLVSRPTDISVFREILDDVSRGADKPVRLHPEDEVDYEQMGRIP